MLACQQSDEWSGAYRPRARASARQRFPHRKPVQLREAAERVSDASELQGRGQPVRDVEEPPPDEVAARRQEWAPDEGGGAATALPEAAFETAERVVVPALPNRAAVVSGQEEHGPLVAGAGERCRDVADALVHDGCHGSECAAAGVPDVRE